MKALFHLKDNKPVRLIIVVILLGLSQVSYSQETFIRGVYMFTNNNVDYTQLRDSLYLNTVQGVVDDTGGTKYLNVLENSGNLDVIGLSLKHDQNSIYRLSSAQRMVFEAEYDNSNPLRNYFNERNGIVLPNADTLLQSPSSPGYMVKSPVPDNEYHYGMTHYTASFILKRAPAASDTTKVVRLEAVCIADSTILDSIILRSGDFTTNNLETKTLEFDLSFDAIPGLKPLGVLLGTLQEISSTCNGVDIRVFWYGNVTTWLDKVIIEDDKAKELFAGLHNSNIINTANDFKNNHNLMKRYYLFDEPNRSSYLANKYVNDKIVNVYVPDTLYGRGSGITAMHNYNLIERFLLDADPRDLLIDPYSIDADIPTPDMTESEAASVGIEPFPINNPEIYDNLLQIKIQQRLVWAYRDAQTFTSQKGKNFFVVPQLHGDYYERNGKFRTPFTDEAQFRPPTGNEVTLQCNIAISYGAKGLIPYPLGTDTVIWQGRGLAYFAGLLTADPCNDGIHRNHWTNYGEFPWKTEVNPNQRMSIRMGYADKWDALANFNNKLKNISADLMSLTWQNAFSIHLGQPTTGDISNVQSYYYPNSESSLIPDAPATTYIELSLFKLKTELNNTNLDYFYVVNRRTLQDDQRVIRVTINKGGSIFTNWKVTEIGTSNTWTVHKTGYFQSTYEPGEGKLFKLEPVMLAGGNIVYNENIPAGTTLDIMGTVTVNQGATLTLNYNSTFNFHYYKSLINNGNLIANLCIINFLGGSASGPIVAPSNWGIRLEKNSTNIISNTVINDARTGIFVYETYAQISGCTIRNCTYSGIDVYRSNYSTSQPLIINNTIFNTPGMGNYGISLTYSSPTIRNNLIENFAKGVYCLNNSSPYLGLYGTQGNNDIVSNQVGVYAYASSNPYLGSLTPYIGGGYNNISNNSDNNIYAYSMCNILAENNWWGSNPPNAAYFFAGGKSSIDYTPWMTSPPADAPEKGPNLLIENERSNSNSIEDGEMIQNDSPTMDIMENILLAKKYVNEGKYLRSINICENIITEFPDTSLSFTALDILWEAGRKLSVPQLRILLRYIYSTSNQNPLFANAGVLLAGYQNNHFELLDSIISNYSGNPIV